MAVFAEQDKCRGVSALIILNRMCNYNILTDANIAAISTGVAGLTGLIATGAALQPPQEEYSLHAAQEGIREMESFGIFTDANINSLTTKAGLRDLIFTGGGLTAIDIDPVTKDDGSEVYSGNVSRETSITL